MWDTGNKGRGQKRLQRGKEERGVEGVGGELGPLESENRLLLKDAISAEMEDNMRVGLE